MKRKIRNFLSKIKFEFGFNPIVDHETSDFSNFIPQNKKAVLLISADFELAWAFRFSKNRKKNINYPVEKAMLARQNIPIILNLCDKFNIPITWVTVGHLFLNECKKGDHDHLLQLNKFKNQYWNYGGNDWFADDPFTGFKQDTAWYAPDLIKMIQNAKVEHEIGCHTFSHIDCSDEICSSEVFLSEINECKKLAQKSGVELKSFVHPGHTIGNLDNLVDEGFTSFRTNYDNRLTFPKKHMNGIWELQNTMELTYRQGWSAKYHIYRYKKIIDRAIKYNKLCYLWFHPSMNPVFTNKVLPRIFEYLDSKRKEIFISTTGDYVDRLNEKHR